MLFVWSRIGWVYPGVDIVDIVRWYSNVLLAKKLLRLRQLHLVNQIQVSAA